MYTESFAVINNDSANLRTPINRSVTANSGVTITNTGDISYQRIQALTKGDVLLVSEHGGISSYSGSRLIANQGSITVQAKDTTNGSIWTANGGSMITSGGKKAGDIILAIGELPKKPVNPVPEAFQPPSTFYVTNDGKGQTFFGENPTSIHSDGSGAPTSIRAFDKRIILNNQSTAGQKIDFSGNNLLITNEPTP